MDDGLTGLYVGMLVGIARMSGNGHGMVLHLVVGWRMCGMRWLSG